MRITFQNDDHPSVQEYKWHRVAYHCDKNSWDINDNRVHDVYKRVDELKLTSKSTREQCDEILDYVIELIESTGDDISFDLVFGSMSSYQEHLMLNFNNPDWSDVFGKLIAIFKCNASSYTLLSALPLNLALHADMSCNGTLYTAYVMASLNTSYSIVKNEEIFDDTYHISFGECFVEAVYMCKTFNPSFSPKLDDIPDCIKSLFRSDIYRAFRISRVAEQRFLYCESKIMRSGYRKWYRSLFLKKNAPYASSSS